jgi:hypothetical protein
MKGTKMNGKETINLFLDYVNKTGGPALRSKIQVAAAEAQMNIYDMSARATACHCECLGMNAENSMAACNGQTPPYSDQAYHEVMQKWGLIDKNGEPLI